MKKRILSMFLTLAMVLGMFPPMALAIDVPFEVYVGEAELTRITQSDLEWKGWDGNTSTVTCYKVVVSADAEEATLYFEDEKDWTYYKSNGEFIDLGSESSDYEHTVAIQDSDGDGELDGISVQVAGGFDTEYYILFVVSEEPFTAVVNDEEVTDITTETLTWTNWDGSTFEVPCYTVKVPAGTTEATLLLDEAMVWTYYSSDGKYIADGSWTDAAEHTVMIQDSNSDGELDGISIQKPQGFGAEYYIRFKYVGVCDHEYEVTNTATCEEGGVKTSTCIHCDESKTETVAALGHDWDEGTQTTAPSCAAMGEKVYTCKRDNSHTKTEPVAKLPHTYGEAVVTKEPTCKEAGVKTYTCSACSEGSEGHTKTATIPKLTTHTYGEDGMAEFCSVCRNPNPDYVDPDMPTLVDGIYQIGTPAELIAFAKYVNKGNTDLSAVLTADIDLTGQTWPGIANSSNTKFSGTFDGQNHTVTFDGSIWGLFGFVMGTCNGISLNEAAVVQNVITDGTTQHAPVVYSAGYAKVINCINKADVKGYNNSYDAGIVGSADYAVQAGVRYNDLLIQNCVNEGDINGVEYIGGILGHAISGTRVEGCSNTGKISGTSTVGGIAGYLQQYQGTSKIKDSYNHGEVTGSSNVGGIVGNLYNGAEVVNCYNAGKATYGIAGYLYNNTASIKDCYYLVSKSAMGFAVDNGDGSKADTTVYVAVAKSLSEMLSEEFVTTMGDKFKQSYCAGPVFTWQDPKYHTGMDEDAICDVCGLGETTFAITFVTGAGYTISGNATVEKGESYSFSVTIAEGYEKTENFVVKVNNEPKTPGADDSYVVPNVQGPLRITVEGVSKIPDTYKVTLPADGNGFDVTPLDGYETDSAKRDGVYKFTVTFVDGFMAGDQFAVKVNNVIQTADSSGVYTVSNIRKALTVTVEGVVTIPQARENTATVTFTVTKHEKEFYQAFGDYAQTNEIFADLELTVPYFDLNLYGLEEYYYNPDCYSLDPTVGRKQTPGNRETAYGVVTYIHAFIYATEVLYLGLNEKDAGTGLSYTDGVFQQAIKWQMQPAGSTFISDLWGYGSNLNYYLNYSYPLGLPEWGSTSDQIAIKDGDILSVHLLNQGNGSDFRFFVVDDTDGKFKAPNATTDKNDPNYRSDLADAPVDQVDSAEVCQGETVQLTLFTTKNSSQYTTGHQTQGNTTLYWLKDDFKKDISAWNTSAFAGLSAEQLKTDANGKITLDTTDLAPGTYYIATPGGFTEGSGQADSTGFVSTGSEAGPALFRLVVKSCEHDHGLQKTEAKTPTCAEAGNSEYWTCSLCGKYFSDADGENEIAENSWVLEATESHTLTHVDAKEATTAAAGNKEYWTCDVCEKVFADAEGQTETTLDAVTIPKKQETVVYPTVTPGQSGTTTNPDGSTTKTETKTDGTVVETTTATDGTVSKIETKKDGSSETTVSTKDGSKSTTSVTASGSVSAEITISSAAVTEAAKAEKPVVLPMPEVVATDNAYTAPVVTITTGTGKTVEVEVPVENVTAGTVAVLVNPDGTETVITGSVPTEGGVAVEIADGATIKIVDNAAKFVDVSAKDWEKNAVDFVSARGIMNGTDSVSFSPDATTTRAQVWTMLARMSGVDTSEGETWYSVGQKWAMENGISDGTNANAEITREQLATMLWRFMGEPTSHHSLEQFDDQNQTSSWAHEAAQWAVEYGVISGSYGSMNPTGDASRAQVAQMFMNLICNVG